VCYTCWGRVPTNLKDRLAIAWDRGTPAEYAAALDAVLASLAP
jgi:hypothetical protein